MEKEKFKEEDLLSQPSFKEDTSSQLPKSSLKRIIILALCFIMFILGGIGGWFLYKSFIKEEELSVVIEEPIKERFRGEVITEPTPKLKALPGIIAETKEKIHKEAKPKVAQTKPSLIETKKHKEKSGAFFISSTPSGAVVYINGVKQKKKTPMVISGLAPGRYTIKIEKKFYTKWIEKVYIKEKEKKKIHAFLELLPGELTVLSSPPEAEVYLNGTSKGKTPIKLSYVKAWTPHRLRLTLEGYMDKECSVFVDPGGKTRIKLILEPKKKEEIKPPKPIQEREPSFVVPEKAYGTVFITSIPPLADVYLNETLLGKTPLRGITIPEGKHILRATKEGYLPSEKEVFILSGENNFVNFTLEKKR